MRDELVPTESSAISMISIKKNVWLNAPGRAWRHISMEV